MAHDLTLEHAEPLLPVPDSGPRRPVLRIAGDDAPVDMAAAEQAAADFLTALGIGLDREELRETPGRMARAYAELFAPKPFELTTFPNDEGYDELVLARDIPFRTVCEHHLLPFAGVAHVGYLPARPDPRAVQAGPPGRAFRRPPADPGTADQAGRRCAGRAPGPARGGRGAGG